MTIIVIPIICFVVNFLLRIYINHALKILLVKYHEPVKVDERIEFLKNSWSDLYLIQGRYIVIMGTPIKASSLNDLNGLDVYPSLYGSSPLMSNRFPRLSTDLTSFVLPSHNQGVGLAF
jgi:hypothetical protein